jgi:transposase-like protein
MAHRLREAMRDGCLLPPMGGNGGIVEAKETHYSPVEESRPSMKRGSRPYTKNGRSGPAGKRAIVALVERGGNGKIVEADETYIGRKEGWKPQRGGAHKMKVLSLVERGGKVRSVRMDAITVENVTPIMRENVARKSRLMTDESKVYVPVGRELAGHEAVNHSAEEWVRNEAHTNTLEGYFSLFKRGMKGVYQHCDEKHLHRYLAEFDFRYNNRVALGVDDTARAVTALLGVVRKRLTYRSPHANASA